MKISKGPWRLGPGLSAVVADGYSEAAEQPGQAKASRNARHADPRASTTRTTRHGSRRSMGRSAPRCRSQALWQRLGCSPTRGEPPTDLIVSARPMAASLGQANFSTPLPRGMWQVRPLSDTSRRVWPMSATCGQEPGPSRSADSAGRGDMPRAPTGQAGGRTATSRPPSAIVLRPSLSRGRSKSSRGS